MFATQQTELLLLWSGLFFYVFAGCWAISILIIHRQVSHLLYPSMLIGFIIHTLAIAYRWKMFGYGPFVTMFEILSSNIWSFVLVWLVTFWRLPSIRKALIMACPVFFMMMGWLLLSNPGQTHFPSSYYTIWLYIHVGFGKVYMGAVLIAVAFSLSILIRGFSNGRWFFHGMPNNDSLSELSFRFLALALVFDSLMLISGAIWAQDAWGRYWAWDPLETSSLVSWLLLAFVIHSRTALELSNKAASWLIILVFCVAFVTFFGLPFISFSPHKGMI